MVKDLFYKHLEDKYKIVILAFVHMQFNHSDFCWLKLHYLQAYTHSIQCCGTNNARAGSAFQGKEITKEGYQANQCSAWYFHLQRSFQLTALMQ